MMIWRQAVEGEDVTSFPVFFPAVAEGSGGEAEGPQLKKNKEGREEREGAVRGSKAALSALVKRPVKGKAGGL